MSVLTELLEPKEAAKACRCSIHTIRAWTFQRKLPVVRLGRKVLFRSEDIQNFIDKNLVASRDEQ